MKIIHNSTNNHTNVSYVKLSYDNYHENITRTLLKFLNLVPVWYDNFSTKTLLSMFKYLDKATNISALL